jgi:heat shock protein beta
MMIDNIVRNLMVITWFVQPESPAELGGKIYEMMTIALGGRWGRLEEAEATASETSVEFGSSEGTVSEVVEPSEVRTESDPWRD